MAKSEGQKLKLLYLMDYFQQKTDERHPVSISELIAYLEERGIHSARKSLYDDMESLRLYGMDIITVREGPRTSYYLGQRDFDLAELKLLADAVLASKFITGKRSRELLNKLDGLASEGQAGQLHRQILVPNQIKSMNESIFYNVDALSEAMEENRMVLFRYFEWTTQKTMQFRREGEYYEISPWVLIWEDENYYLIGYDEKARQLKYYRVDKMSGIRAGKKERLGKAAMEKLDLQNFSTMTFQMFEGKTETVTLLCENRLVGVVLDRFGKEILIQKVDGEHFLTRVKVAVSGPFLGWVFGLGRGITIQGPEWVQKEFLRQAREIIREQKK